ncbi:MAG: deoxyhypusine synthase family protein [Thermodesulfobacteriota bacterium]
MEFICPEPAHWGGLSGCTYSEGVSWGKFNSLEEGGRYAEVLCDAMIAWPVLMAGVRQKILRKRKDRLNEFQKKKFFLSFHFHIAFGFPVP